MRLHDLIERRRRTPLGPTPPARVALNSQDTMGLVWANLAGWLVGGLNKRPTCMEYLIDLFQHGSKAACGEVLFFLLAPCDACLGR